MGSRDGAKLNENKKKQKNPNHNRKTNVTNVTNVTLDPIGGRGIPAKHCEFQ
jgi:hypothetical protein